MNDNELSTMVCESVADLRSTTPVDQVISRGRAVRARRRVPAAAGALVVAGGAALGVATLVPAGHPAGTSHPAVVRLDAWTVAKQANGDIDVTIRQLQDPARLQATLRADGLPVHVSFSGHPGSVVCQSYRSTSPKILYRILTTTLMRKGGDFMTIDPSALPSGAGLSIFDKPRNRPGGSFGFVAVSLVKASQQCTG